MVRTNGAYIRTYQTHPLLCHVFHMMSMLTASHAASMIDTTDYIMCGNGGRCRSYDHEMLYIRITHDIPW